MIESEIIYSNCFGMLTQNNLLSRYELTIKNHSFFFSPKELRHFLKEIKTIDLITYLNSSSSIETFFFPELDILLILSITELVYLKELTSGSLCMLELNTILEEALNVSYSTQLS